MQREVERVVLDVDRVAVLARDRGDAAVAGGVVEGAGARAGGAAAVLDDRALLGVPEGVRVPAEGGAVRGGVCGGDEVAPYLS